MNKEILRNLSRYLRKNNGKNKSYPVLNGVKGPIILVSLDDYLCEIYIRDSNVIWYDGLRKTKFPLGDPDCFENISNFLKEQA